MLAGARSFTAIAEWAADADRARGIFAFRAPGGIGMSIAAAMVLLAARIWQAAAQSASHRQEPATMPVSSL